MGHVCYLLAAKSENDQSGYLFNMPMKSLIHKISPTKQDLNIPQ